MRTLIFSCLLSLMVMPSLGQSARTELAASQQTASGAYAVPFASKDNVLELAVDNPMGATISTVEVSLKEVPSWVEVAHSTVTLEAEAPARFLFSVAEGAPVGEAGAFEVELIAGGRVVGRKRIQVVVEAPREITLKGNYPNPFNPETTIGFVLPEVSRVDLRVYDVLGREVARLLEEERGVGYHAVNWNAGGLASGFYLYRLVVHPVGAIRESPAMTVKQGRMVLIK